MANTSRRRRPWMPAAALSLGALGLGGCQSSVLDPQGPIGRAETSILFNALAIMLCIVVPTIAATLAVAWWFRAGNARAQRLPEFAYSGRIELVTWSIPVLAILFLGGLAWAGSHDLDPAKSLPGKQPLQVQVVSLDWKWLFIYPDQHIASVNRLVFPADRPVHFALTSASVMNAFFIPQLGSMIYTMNGMATQLWLQADRTGAFAGRSSHFSGDGFSDMHFDVNAVTPEAFNAWVQQAQGAGPTLDDAAYNKLAEQSSDVAPATWRAVAPDLFRDVLTQKLPPGPGPRVGQPTPDVSPRREG